MRGIVEGSGTIGGVAGACPSRRLARYLHPTPVKPYNDPAWLNQEGNIMGQSKSIDTAYPQDAVPPKPPRPALPPTVDRAVLLMRAGAVLTVASGLVTILRAGQLNVGNQSVNGAAYDTGYIVGYMLWYLVLAGLWLWMAQANKAGKNWARITGTVFFGISCLIMLISVVGDLADAGQDSGLAFVSLAATVSTWIVGLFAVILLWHKMSATHFAVVPMPYQYPAPGPGYYRPMPGSNTTMDGLGQQQPATDPWGTPGGQA